MIIYVLNIIIVISSLILPGMVVVQSFFRKYLDNWIYSFRIVIYVIISLSVIFLFAFILDGIHLPQIAKRLFAISIVLGSAILLLIQNRLRKERKYIKSIEKIPFLLIFCTSMLFISWMVCIYFNHFPGIGMLGMADMPEYYVLARNIYSGRSFTTDYFIGNLWTGPKFGIQDVIGSPPAASRRPLIPYITSYFFYLGGQNQYIINMIASILACLIPITTYSFFYHYTITRNISISPKRDLFYQLAAILICIIPSHFPLFAFGETIIFTMLTLFILIFLIKTGDFKSPLSIMVMALSAGLTVISRPEGTILIFVVYIVYFLPGILIYIFRKKLSARLLPAVFIAFGVILMSIPTLLINYSPVSGGVWYQTLYYNPQTKDFETKYPRWPDFNRAIIQVNFSDSPDIEGLLNKNVLCDVIHYPVSFGKWVLKEGTKEFLYFHNLYTAGIPPQSPIVYDIRAPILPSFYYYNPTDSFRLRLYSINIAILKSLKVLIPWFFLIFCVILGPAWEIVVFLCLFLLGFPVLSPVLHTRQAMLMSPLLISAFTLAISMKSNLKNKILDEFLSYNKLPNLYLLLRYIKSGFVSIYSTVHRIEDIIFSKLHIHNQHASRYFTLAFIILCLTMLIVIETREVFLDIILPYQSDNYLLAADMIKSYTEPSSVVICDYPQFINLMTGRVTVGCNEGSIMLKVLSPIWERYEPDYLLLSYYSSSSTVNPELLISNEYVSKNYTLMKYDSEKHIVLLRHR